MQQLEQELKTLIIETLDLEDLKAEDIDSESLLFSEDGLGLDSVDALELGLAIQKTYGVHFKADDKNTQNHFKNIHSLAAFIAQHKEQQ